MCSSDLPKAEEITIPKPFKPKVASREPAREKPKAVAPPGQLKAKPQARESKPPSPVWEQVADIHEQKQKGETKDLLNKLLGVIDEPKKTEQKGTAPITAREEKKEETKMPTPEKPAPPDEKEESGSTKLKAGQRIKFD